ncbi:MAG: DNA translocase FtsK [Anaerolineae bacterium]|nr:DNA translocase FtsK [Anaerolineae bacterium]MDW8071060.1 DNA translocase FtsK 4TM domain-containing protein [Anaerolineae bacterium]
MSRRASGKKRTAQHSRKPEVAGVILLISALLTALSLLSISRGPITQRWLFLLNQLVGWGMYLVPLILAALGIWLLRRFAADPAEERSEKLVGGFLLFLALLALFELIEPRQELAAGEYPGGGGVIGWVLGTLLINGLGTVGAVMVLSAILLVCLIMLSDLSLANVVLWMRQKIQAREERRRHEELARLSTPPPTPSHRSGSAPSGLLKRLFSLLHLSTEVVSTQPAPSSSETILSPTRLPRPANLGLSSPGGLFPRVVGDQGWQLPPIESILEEGVEYEISQQDIRERVRIIEETLASFGIEARVREINPGPAVTQFSIEPGYMHTKDGQGQPRKVRVSRIVNLANDLALALSASPIRIEAPIPGRPYVGIEVPNPTKSLVSLRSVLESDAFRQHSGALRIALGRDVSGQAVVADLAAMPHLLIAGATGSGKSVCINAIIATFLLTHTPETLRLIMVDPKMVELISYNGIPHLLAPVVVDLGRVMGVLNWAIKEMDQRYKTFSELGVRNLVAYNELMAGKGQRPMPYIVIIIDELADVMMTSPDEVERAITRLAQMARATGIHLIIATQRPSVDVVTGLIKANFPARIAFAVTSQVDSRVILDSPGAERLLGRGDMLFMSPESTKLQRLQGVYVSDRELSRLVRFWKGSGLSEPALVSPGAPILSESGTSKSIGYVVQSTLWPESEALSETAPPDSEVDDLLERAIEVVRSQQRASVSLLQRRLRIGYARAARLIDLLEERGIIGPDEGGGRARRVLLTSPDESERRERSGR